MIECNIAALDPGRDKCGLAVLAADGSILYREVVPTSSLMEEMRNRQREFSFDRLIIGDGTTSRNMQDKIRQQMSGIEICEVDEYNTTQMAKKEYWKLCPPTGWRKLLPLSLQEPPVPVDDVVAVILGRRYLHEGK